MPKTVVGADRAKVTATPLYAKEGSSSVKLHHSKDLAAMAKIGASRYGFFEAPEPTLGTDDPPPIQKRLVRVLGESFMISTEKYERINELPKSTWGDPYKSGISEDKKFTGRFFNILSTPMPREGWPSHDSNGDFIRPYGGSQDWYDDENMRFTGCGSIAAANILFYYGRNWTADIPFRLSPTYIQFRDAASDIYNNFVKQTLGGIASMVNADDSTWGIWRMPTLANGVVQYAQVRGRVHLTSDIITNSNTTYEQAVNFIKTSLQKDNPVVLLITGNDYIAQTRDDIADKPIQMLELHFVTITAMTEVKSVEITETTHNNKEISRTVKPTYDYELRTSDWGVRRFIPSLKQMWESNTTSSEAISRALEAARVSLPNIVKGIIAPVTPLASVSLASFQLWSGPSAPSIVPDNVEDTFNTFG